MNFLALHAAFLTELCSMELLTSTSHKTNQQGQMKVVYKCSVLFVHSMSECLTVYFGSFNWQRKKTMENLLR